MAALRHTCGGVMLVTHHEKHGACLVLFHNQQRRQWESPWGTFEQRHHDLIDTAADELLEESCLLVCCPRDTLVANVALGLKVDVKLGESSRSSTTPWGGPLVGLRVDCLSRAQFNTNFRALRRLRRAAGRSANLGCAIEMDRMTFVRLDALEAGYSRSWSSPPGPVQVADVDGRLCELGLQKKLLFTRSSGDGPSCGLELARRTYEHGATQHAPLRAPLRCIKARAYVCRCMAARAAGRDVRVAPLSRPAPRRRLDSHGREYCSAAGHLAGGC